MVSVIKLKLIINHFFAVLVEVLVNLLHQLAKQVMHYVCGQMIIHFPNIFVCSFVNGLKPFGVSFLAILNAINSCLFNLNFPLSLDVLILFGICHFDFHFLLLDTCRKGILI